MTKKDKLKQILKNFVGTDDTMLAGFKVFDEGVSKLKNDLQEKVRASTLKEVNSKIGEFQSKLDLKPLVGLVENLKNEFSDKISNLGTEIKIKLAEYQKLDDSQDQIYKEQLVELNDELSSLRGQYKNLVSEYSGKLENLRQDLLSADIVQDEKLNKKLNTVESKISSLEKSLSQKDEEITAESKKQLDSLKAEMLTRLNEKGGGSMNRQILINNVDPLKRYTDINLKAGSNVTITYANNNQTKKVDVTISATGGGGGTTRSIQSISASQTADAVSGTDYVYLCSGTLTLTLPDATTNTNLYTIKNVGTGVVTVNTTSSQTIDGALTQVMPVQFTSIDVISDTANWNIT